MGKSKRLFVISSKHRQISVQNSNVEHHFLILQIHIGRTPYEGSRDDTQVRGELTHRSTMTRLTGRQRQWLTIPATSTMTHGSTHQLVNLSPKTRHALNTVEQASLSQGLLHCNACGACNSPTQQCLAKYTPCACMTVLTHWITSPLKLDMHSTLC
jgi:hypothetical protein